MVTYENQVRFSCWCGHCGDLPWEVLDSYRDKPASWSSSQESEPIPVHLTSTKYGAKNNFGPLEIIREQQ